MTYNSPRYMVAGEVVDTSALISWPVKMLFESLASPKQRNELNNNYPERMDIIDAIDINWTNPNIESIEKIIHISKETGDIAGLSETDIEVLALAMEYNYTLVTDDYRMQNMAEYMKIKWRSVNTVGISNIWKWEVICLGCKTVKIMPESTSNQKNNLGQCVDCGSELKIRKKK